MALGFDEKRPDKYDYQRFERKLTQGLKEANIPGLSVLIYGSYPANKAVYGRSDVDAVFIFDDDVVINKQDLSKVSKIIANSYQGLNIPLQFNATDLRTMKDGVFNTFPPNFKECFEQRPVIIIGPDYRKQFSYSPPDPNLRQHSEARFNLRKARTNLLLSEIYCQEPSKRSYSYVKFIENFHRSMESILNGTDKVAMFNRVNNRKRNITDKFSAAQSVKNIYPNIDTTPIEKIIYYFSEEGLPVLDSIYHNPDEVRKVWNEGLTCFEQVIKEYLDSFIKPSAGFDSHIKKIQKDSMGKQARSEQGSKDMHVR